MVTIQKAAPCSKGSVASITLENANGMRVTLLSYGATIQSILVPDKDGRMTDVLLGYETVKEYEENDGYLGACIGRNGNRIAGAAFTLNGQRFHLTANEGKNQLHGGLCGFDKKLWNYNCRENSVEFTTVLADGEEGYPGTLTVSVRFSWKGDALSIRYHAVSDRDTILNLTNHSYFNLDGEGTVQEQLLCVNADAFTPNDAGCLPLGVIAPVAGTAMDFRTMKPIGRDADRDEDCVRLSGGYDANFVLNAGAPAAVAKSLKTGVVMTMTTDQPGVQFYTACTTDYADGKGGMHYLPYSGLCLETQHYPDSPNHPNFPTTTLRPGEIYDTTTIYAFRVDA